jgi:hypothetical protein
MSKKPVLLVCGCRKYEEYVHAAIRRFDCPEWETIGLVGDPTESVASFNETTRILTIPTADTYEMLPTKLHAAYTWIFSNRPGIPGIFKTDEDILFDMSALVQSVVSNTDIPYWGVTASICHEAPINQIRIQNRFEDKTLTPTHQSATYCFGAGYWLSKEALPHILSAKDVYASSYLEDVCTGFVMNRAGWGPQCIRVLFKEVPRTPSLLKLSRPKL